MGFFDHLSRTVRGRSRAVSGSFVLAGVAMLSLAPVASAPPATAAVATQSPDISLFSGNARFHVGGHSWVLSVFTFSGSVGIDLSTTHELDSWNFNDVPKADLKTNASTGTATLNVHSALAPVVFANLRFSPRTKVEASCPSGFAIIFDGKVTGSISLVANHSGLKFRSKHVTFTGSTLDFDHQCMTPSGPTACISGFWNVGRAVTASGNGPGLPGRHTFFVNISKTAALRAPKHAIVSHEIFGVASKPVFNSKAKRLSVKAIRVVKGSAALVATAPPSVITSSCTIGNQHFKQREASYFGSFRSPAGGQLRARSLVAGLIKVARSGRAFFDVITLKKA